MTTKTNTKELIVPFKEFRTHAVEYIDALSKGARFLVVKRSRPVFRLEPVNEIWETIADFRSMKGGGISAEKLIKIIQKNLKKK